MSPRVEKEDEGECFRDCGRGSVLDVIVDEDDPDDEEENRLCTVLVGEIRVLMLSTDTCLVGVRGSMLRPLDPPRVAARLCMVGDRCRSACMASIFFSSCAQVPNSARLGPRCLNSRSAGLSSLE